MSSASSSSDDQGGVSLGNYQEIVEALTAMDTTMKVNTRPVQQDQMRKGTDAAPSAAERNTDDLHTQEQREECQVQIANLQKEIANLRHVMARWGTPELEAEVQQIRDMKLRLQAVLVLIHAGATSFLPPVEDSYEAAMATIQGRANFGDPKVSHLQLRKELMDAFLTIGSPSKIVEALPGLEDLRREAVDRRTRGIDPRSVVTIGLPHEKKRRFRKREKPGESPSSSSKAELHSPGTS